MNIRIRRAVETDCPRLRELVVELAIFQKEPDAVKISVEQFAASGFGPNPVWWAFVAVLTDEKGNETIEGFALYYIRFSTWKGNRLYLEDFHVTEKLRGQGVGRSLFTHLIEEARERQLSGIVWQVLNWNEPAIQFYKKLNADFSDNRIDCSIEVY